MIRRILSGRLEGDLLGIMIARRISRTRVNCCYRVNRSYLALGARDFGETEI